MTKLFLFAQSAWIPASGVLGSTAPLLAPVSSLLVGTPLRPRLGLVPVITPKAPHFWPPLMRAALQSTMSLLLLCFSLHSGSCWLYFHPETQSRRAKLNIYTGNPDPLLLIGMAKGNVAMFHVYVSRICLETISRPDK